MSKRSQGPMGRRPPKNWVAEPYQPGEIYYDPTTDPSPLRMARLWFGAKYPKTSCLLTGLFFLGLIGGYLWLTIFAFIQSGGDMNPWMGLGLALVCLPFILLIALWFRKAARRAASKPALVLGPPARQKRKQQQPDTQSNEPPPALPDLADPAGLARGLPKRRVHDMPKLRIPRSRGRAKKEKTGP